jgi:hypothetical protein
MQCVWLFLGPHGARATNLRDERAVLQTGLQQLLGVRAIVGEHTLLRGHWRKAQAHPVSPAQHPKGPFRQHDHRGHHERPMAAQQAGVVGLPGQGPGQGPFDCCSR